MVRGLYIFICRYAAWAMTMTRTATVTSGSSASFRQSGREDIRRREGVAGKTGLYEHGRRCVYRLSFLPEKLERQIILRQHLRCPDQVMVNEKVVG